MTHGDGASSVEKTWTAKTATWMKALYPQGIDARNIAVGGTTSQYAVFRLNRDLQGFVPDVVFIDFSVNDPVLQSFVDTNMDALIYKFRALNPKVIINTVAVTTSAQEAARLSGQEPESTRLARTITEANQAHFIDVGAFLWGRIIENGVTVRHYLPDGVHPNDMGQELYFEKLRDDLATYLPTATGTGAVSSYLNATGLANATIWPVSAVRNTDCALKDGALVCDLGQIMRYDFEGSAIGFSSLTAGDGGQMFCTLDGKKRRTMNFWDKYAQRIGSRENAAVLYEGLTDTRHTLECRVNDVILSNSGLSSVGHMARISGLLVTKPQNDGF